MVQLRVLVELVLNCWGVQPFAAKTPLLVGLNDRQLNVKQQQLLDRCIQLKVT